jgi:signal transduction histidine kinase
VEAGRQRTAHYTQVPPGAYQFRVIAANNEGAWNVEGAFLSVTVLPGWWQTGWFRSLVLAATLGVVAMAYRYRIRRVRETERVRLRIARDLHDEVGSNLGSIALLSQAAAGSASQAAATEFSEIHKLARKTADAMRDIVWLINPDEDRLERLVLRMKETAGQLLAGTPWRMQAPDALPAERLSTEFKRHVFLIYKEALHNAARHARASLVEIELQLHGRRLELTISDDGTGIPPQLLHSGQGLDNMRRRAAEIGGTIRIDGEPGTGTIIHLSAPFR